MRDLIKTGIFMALAAFMFLALVPTLEQQNEAELRVRQAQYEAAENAYLEPFVRAFTSGDWQQILTHCLNASNDASPYFHPPQALAMAADRVDAYVYEGLRPDTLKRISCSAAGLKEGRVDHPLKALVPVEQVDRDRGSDNPWGEMGMLLRTRSTFAASIELVLRPDDGQMLRRTITRQDSGWQLLQP